MPAQDEKALKRATNIVKNISAFCGLAGILIVGTGIYIGGTIEMHGYIYVVLLIQSIIFGILILIGVYMRKKGYSLFLHIITIILTIIALSIYIYYVIASFLYY